jgi:small nuclear ribonucleoprotein D3
MTSNIGVPTKLLHEALGHVITVELKTGQVYRGKLHDGISSIIYPIVNWWALAPEVLKADVGLAC